jgi:hypothetical protein
VTACRQKGKLTVTATSSALILEKTDLSTQTSRHLPNYISLISLTFPAPEAGDFV